MWLIDCSALAPISLLFSLILHNLNICFNPEVKCYVQINFSVVVLLKLKICCLKFKFLNNSRNDDSCTKTTSQPYLDSQTTYNFAFKSQLGIVSNLNEFSKPKKFRKRIALNYVFKRWEFRMFQEYHVYPNLS